MKPRVPFCAIGLGGFAASALSAPSGPQNGAINFTGSIIESPCEVETSSRTQIVDFGINNWRNHFTGIGSRGPQLLIGINVVGCNVAERVSVRFNASSIEDGKVAVTGGASGIAIGIEYNGSLITIGDSITPASDNASGGVDFLFKAAYYQIDPVVVPGQANAVVTFELTFT